MGVRICKPCSQKAEIDEIIFSNRYKRRSSDATYYGNSKLYNSNLNTNYNLTESEYYKIKSNIESLIKEKGEIIENLKITEI